MKTWIGKKIHLIKGYSFKYFGIISESVKPESLLILIKCLLKSHIEAIFVKKIVFCQRNTFLKFD